MKKCMRLWAVSVAALALTSGLVAHAGGERELLVRLGKLLYVSNETVDVALNSAAGRKYMQALLGKPAEASLSAAELVARKNEIFQVLGKRGTNTQKAAEEFVTRMEAIEKRALFASKRGQGSFLAAIEGEAAQLELRQMSEGARMVINPARSSFSQAKSEFLGSNVAKKLSQGDNVYDSDGSIVGTVGKIQPDGQVVLKLDLFDRTVERTIRIEQIQYRKPRLTENTTELPAEPIVPQYVLEKVKDDEFLRHIKDYYGINQDP